MPFPWLAVQVGAAMAMLVGEQIYHRWFADKPTKRIPRRDITIPQTDEGTPMPLIYGRVRVREPVLVWHSAPAFESPSYTMNLFFVLGLVMDDGKGTNRVHSMWAGDTDPSYNNGFWDQIGSPMTGAGGPESPISVQLSTINSDQLGFGFVEFLNGNPSQVLANDGENDTNAYTQAGRTLLRAGTTGGSLTASQIPGYRGMLSVLLYRDSTHSWKYGTSQNIPAYSFEASSYQSGNSFPAVGIYAQIGRDSNPINVLYDLLTSKQGKGGIDRAFIDPVSWAAAALTCYQEGNGYSRCITDANTLGDHIQEILRQIDAALYADESDGLIKIKMVRNDYNLSSLPVISKATGCEIVNFAMSGWTNIINKIRIVYTDRDAGYVDKSVTEQNHANAVGQDGIENELVLQMPGVTYEALAVRLAQRELSMRSRPIMKCRAIVDRSFIRVNPGAPIMVAWSSPDINNVVFRVAAVDRGTLADGRIALDLIQAAEYTYRQIPPQPGGFIRPGINLGMNGFG